MKRVKRLLVLILPVALIVLALASASFTAATPDHSPGQVEVSVDGKQLVLDVNPQVTGGRVLVPLRAISEALGARVSWDKATKTVTVTRGETTVQVTLNNTLAFKNGQAVTLEVPATVIRGRTMVPLRFLGEAFGAEVAWNGETRKVSIETHVLPVVGSFENLKKLLAQVETSRARYMAPVLALEEGAVSGAQPKAGSDAAAYSRTNIQVQGVDEADVVKTDGTYIYQVNDDRVVVARVYPADRLEIVKILEYQDENFSPSELYVDEKYLVVIGSTWSYRSEPVPEKALRPQEVKPEIFPPPVPVRHTVKAVIYDLTDLTDKEQVTKIREVELEGNYVSSRKIGPALYLVANKYLDYYWIMRENMAPPAPVYRDSASGSGFLEVSYSDIRYFPDAIEPNYLLVAGLNLDHPEQEMEVSTYLGAGESIYASTENLYVAVTRYEREVRPLSGDTVGPEGYAPAEASTVVYRFALEGGRVKYTGKGEVPGRILNQFSMDEHEGYFRIATTKGEIWRTDQYTSRNNLYVLDENLEITGKIEDIAPGERIYSVRFMGDRAYMVTFKKVDPLFVLDLENPQQPRILGKLKIPGYSDYLHPYDETHIIGFGKDTIELPQEDGSVRGRATMAFYQGMKIAIFDVSDVAHPVEMFKVIIGDRGTDSELLRNHKALLFARDKNLLAFPVTVMEVKDQGADVGFVPRYGEFVFQGAYVYHLDLVKGFQLKGKITHLTGDDYLKSGYTWFNSPRNVERILYIDNNLYTLSREMIKVHDLETLAEKHSLAIPR